MTRWCIDKFRQLLLTYIAAILSSNLVPAPLYDGCKGVKMINIKHNDSNQNDGPVKLTQARVSKLKERFESVGESS